MKLSKSPGNKSTPEVILSARRMDPYVKINRPLWLFCPSGVSVFLRLFYPLGEDRSSTKIRLSHEVCSLSFLLTEI